MPLILLLLLLVSCAGPRGPWVVKGAVTHEEEVQALALVEAAKRVLPDEKDWLAAGGDLWILPDVAFACPAPVGLTPSGCNTPGTIWVLWPHPKCPGTNDLTCSSLAHELCHLGLERGGGTPLTKVRIATEAEANACALLVVLEYRRSLPVAQ